MINYGVIDMLSKELDIKTLRNELISSNIANIDTPGYKGKDIDFKSLLSESLNDIEMKRTDPRHIRPEDSFGQNGPEIIVDPNSGRADGNNVNIEGEMLKLTENNIQYNVSVHLVAKKLQGLRKAIDEAARN